MKELREVLSAANATTEPMALATVVGVEGSSYRRPGARMLMTMDGPIAGSVSGGCLESDVIEHARSVIASGEPCLLTYDTRSDDDALFGLGIGCAGLIQILIERVTPSHPALTLPASWIGSRESAVLATVIDADDKTRIGERALLPPASGGPGWAPSLTTDYGATRVFLEVLTPPLSLVLCGAGADALPLVRIANELGWRVTVADHRPAYANPARFPGADDVIAARPEHLREHLTLDLRTAVVVMTHNYGLDSALLSLLSQTPVAYLGLLGSARRTERMLADLREADPEKFARLEETIHAPIGLDLGAATPEEIALSVVAEIKAVTTGRSGASLRTRRVQPSSASEARRAASPGGHRACAIAG